MELIKKGIVMEVVKTKDPMVIESIGERIIKFVEENEVVEYDANSFIQWLRASIGSPYVVVIVAMNEDNVVGYCVASIIATFKNERLEIIQFSGDTEEIEKEIISYVQKWSKKLFVKRISTISKFPKKWKDFGFELNAHILSIEVK